jgi:NAD(P)-dependent dehydrogenase (short-subunit alcohol dehydrogenase family)
MSGLNLEGKSVAVTGGGSGLGRAYVLELARQGANLVINDIDGARAESVADEVLKVGLGRVEVLVGSVADLEVAQAITSLCVRSFGTIDGLVNNAGILHNSLPWDEQEPRVRRAVEVNVLGSMFCGISAMRHMIARSSGAIVNVTSGTLTGMSALATYGITKGAIASMVYGWSLETAGTGVRVNGIMPMAATGMTRVRDDWTVSTGRPASTGRSGQSPEHVAPVVAYLLSDAAEQLNGVIVRHDGYRITLVNRPTWTGGHELEANEELGFSEVAEIIEGLRTA